MKIGFIGLGNMGLPMALNLCKKGFSIMVCSSKKESQNRILEAGGQAAESFCTMAEDCDVVISIVPADLEIRQLYMGEKSLISAARQGLICIDMTSAMGATKKEIALYIEQSGKNIKFIDAPVSGGVSGAEGGTLTIMAGGEKNVVEDCLPIFQAMGKRIVYTGEVGSASNVKMINQMLNAANTAVAAEALCLSRRLGVDDEILSQVVNESSGGSYVFEKNVPKYMMTGNHQPGFRLKLMKKDVELYLETAKKMKEFTLIPQLVYQIYAAAENQGNGDLNYTCIYEWFKQNQPVLEKERLD